jgi:hypothetical protein
MIWRNWGPDEIISIAAGTLTPHEDPGAFPKQVMVFSFQSDEEEIVITIRNAQSARYLAQEILKVADEVWGAQS